jgi:citronellol/citronellal dehydrogenase
MTPAATRSLAGKTLFITGASRGIGLAIAMRAARDGANVVVAAKSVTENPRIPGTIYTAAAEIEAAGGQGSPCRHHFDDQSSGISRPRPASVDRHRRNASAIDLRGIDALR